MDKKGMKKFYVISIIVLILGMTVALALPALPLTPRNTNTSVTIGKRFIITGGPNIGADVPGIIFDKHQFTIIEWGRDRHIGLTGCNGISDLSMIRLDVGRTVSCGNYRVKLLDLISTQSRSFNDEGYIAVLTFSKTIQSPRPQFWTDDYFVIVN